MPCPSAQRLHSSYKHSNTREKASSCIACSSLFTVFWADDSLKSRPFHWHFTFMIWKSKKKKTKYMLLSRQQNVCQNRDKKIANRSFENVSQFKYLGTTITNQNLIQEEIKGWLNCGNACYHSVQNLLSSRLLSKNLKIRIYKTIILPVVLYGCETSPLTLREEHRLRLFGTEERWGDRRLEKLHNEEFHDLYSSPSMIRIIKSRRMRWAGHVARMGRRGTRTGCWWESQREGDH
jgi:hypothetical protein